VCEGPFDALALLAAGYSSAVAIFGAQGWRWDWISHISRIVFALDADDTGQRSMHQLAYDASVRGLHVRCLSACAYGGHKDASAAWAGGVLQIDGSR